MREDGSCALRYWSEWAVVPTGREHSTERGVWEVWVEAGVPRSNFVVVRWSAFDIRKWGDLRA